MATVRRHDSFLKTICEPAEKGEQLSWLAEGMFELADGKKFVGLAANQVGFNKRLIVINCNGFKQAVINPVIESQGRGMGRAEEGCLSFPSRRVTVFRYKYCIVSGFDLAWQRILFKSKNFLARVWQHEVDHLDGITMYDRVRMEKEAVNNVRRVNS